MISCHPVILSEFPTPLARPTLHHHLGLRIELDAVARLGVEIAKEAGVPAAKGEVGHGRGHANVDTDIAGVNFVTEFAGHRAAAGKRCEDCMNNG